MNAGWLTYAPKPPALGPGERWHLFISYRSVSRPWVLQLYDTLKLLNYEPFLDQYALSAAAPLALSLSEALGSSRAAILVWSSAFEDSNWCMTELSTLISMEQSRPPFRYVIAKIDAAPLPAIAQGKIYIDFSDQRDRCTGANLLRLLFGIAGEPLSPEAVKAAAEYDEAVKQAGASIKAARIAGDLKCLNELAADRGLEWTTTPTLVCEVAEAMIALDQCPAALELLEPVVTSFPRALRPRQLKGLALARSGNWSAAQLVLGELYAAGEIDPETLGIYARTWMDRYTKTGNRLLLLKSRDLYRQAFEAAPRDYYTGINAAAKSLMLGEKETAAQLAKRVEGIVGTAASPGDYWRSATVAEVQLLQGNYPAAAALYLHAVAEAPLEIGSHRSTRSQAAALLEALGASPEQRDTVLASFAHMPIGS